MTRFRSALPAIMLTGILATAGTDPVWAEEPANVSSETQSPAQQVDTAEQSDVGENPARTGEIPEQTPAVDCNGYTPPEERADPQHLVLRGVTCFEEGEYVLAMKFYRNAYKLSPTPLFKAAIGRAFQELGFPVVAVHYYRSYLAETQDADADEGTEKIRQRLKTIEQQLEQEGVPVRLESMPPGAKVYVVIDGTHWEELGSTPLRTTLLPGEYEFAFERPGYRVRTDTVYVAPVADETELDVELVSHEAVFDVSNRRWKRNGALVMFGAMPIIAGGTALVVLGSLQRTDAMALEPGASREQMLRQAAAYRRWGVVTGAVGITALVTGIVFYVVGASNPRGAREARPWQPRIGPGYAGFEAYFR